MLDLILLKAEMPGPSIFLVVFLSNKFYAQMSLLPNQRFRICQPLARHPRECGDLLPEF